MKYFLSLSLLFLFSITSYTLDASYDIGEELIMVARSRTSLDHKTTFDLSVPLYSIYWYPSNNQYYYVKDGFELIKTNDLTYKLDSKKEEKIFVEDIKDPYLQFAGYISTSQRLYIDKRDNQQYIKLLIPIQDPIEVVPTITAYDNGKYMFTSFQEKPYWSFNPKIGKDVLTKDDRKYGRYPHNGKLTIDTGPEE